MPLVEGPAAQLARRLRDLRVNHWRDRNITQAQLADALAGSGRRPSVPSISSWENPANPALPPVHRLESYATFFATSRSVERRPYRLLDLSELTPSERATREQLLTDLTELHVAAKSGPSAAASGPLRDSVLRFPPGEGIVLVCAPLPAKARQQMPQPDPIDPDHVDLYDYGDLDALMELYGRLSALNPDSPIQRVLSDNLTSEHFINHLIILGGVDFNAAIRDLVERTSAPIRQIPRETIQDLGGFEVETATSADNDSPTFEPQVLDIDGQSQIGEDVAQIYYGPNPYFQERTVMSFNGQFARGTLGAVRALTDPNLRDQNEAYLHQRFATAEEWTLLTRVVIVEGQPITPSWSLSDTRLYSWPELRASRG
ncbi:MAG TPA: helix-turn-helix transcriptional regulator [Pseudonocardiaceae bacterium]